MDAKALTVIGDAFIDIVVPINKFAKEGAFNTHISFEYGGTANVVVWANRLGVKSIFAGKIGNDVLGRTFKENLSKEGVKDLCIIDKHFPTGICICLVYRDGHRMMITNRGANDNLSVSDIKKIENRLLEGNIIFLTGYSLISEKTSKAIFYIAKKAKKNDKLICFNPGSPNIINGTFLEILKKYCDILILNYEEAKSLSGKKTVNDILERLKKLVSLIVLTLGEGGSITWNEGEIIKTHAVKVKKVVDTTGAGDAFSAGFLVGLLKGCNMKKSLELGHKTASEVIQRYGAR